MREHRDDLRIQVLVGVGQAFDIHSGETPQAPVWMRENGLEWLSSGCAGIHGVFGAVISFATQSSSLRCSRNT